MKQQQKTMEKGNVIFRLAKLYYLNFYFSTKIMKYAKK